jgi:HPt (histidine-containing phosphotransfer) domain-containing protein
MIAYYDVKTVAKSPYIDDTILNEIKEFMGEEGEATINELLSIFLNNTPKAILRIGDDIKSGDLQALTAHVHGLKGSSAAVGVIGISNICRAIESELRESRTSELGALYEKILGVYKLVEIEFRERL